MGVRPGGAGASSPIRGTDGARGSARVTFSQGGVPARLAFADWTKRKRIFESYLVIYPVVKNRPWLTRQERCSLSEDLKSNLS